MMRRLGTDDYAVDAVTAAKALVGAWLCRRPHCIGWSGRMFE